MKLDEFLDADELCARLIYLHFQNHFFSRNGDRASVKTPGHA